MHYVFSTLFSIFILLNTLLSIPFDEIENAFAKGDTNKIIELGTTKMLISIEGKEGVYSKPQGVQVLQLFFSENPAQSFHFKFRGKESGNSVFAVGSYCSERSFRISLKFKKIKEQYLIESITITYYTK